MPRVNLIQFRKGTAAQWTSVNPVLDSGEPGFESDTNKLKFGDGTTAWNSLAYVSGGASVTTSETAPASPTPNMVWFNSTEATSYIYYDSTWVPLSAGIAGPTGPTGILISDTAPTNTSQLWADSAATGSYIVPANGTKGQVLTKVSDTSYDTGWTTPVGSGNVIINGGFDIWQRGTTIVGAGYSADRWVITQSASGSPTITATQSTVVPDNSVKYSLRYTTSVNAATSISEMACRQRLETQSVLPLVGNTVTVSFWYYSNVTGNHGVRIGLDTNNSQAYANESSALFSYPTAGVWKKVTQTFNNFVNHSFGTAPLEAAAFFLDIGPTVGGGIGQASLAVGSYWNIAKVQVESGSTATAFKRNSPNAQSELASCQRYYWKFDQATSPYAYIANGIVSGTTQAKVIFKHPVKMRSSASIGVTNPSNLQFINSGAQVSAISMDMSTPDTFGAFIDTSSAMTVGQGVLLIGRNSIDYKIEFSAEL